MRYTAILIAAALCACEAQRSADAIVLHSAKPAETVADCIQGRWLSTNLTFAVINAPNGEGFTVQLHNGNWPLVIADTHPSGTGSTVRIHKGGYGDYGLTDQARACL